MYYRQLNFDQVAFSVFILSFFMLIFIIISIYKNCHNGHNVYACLLGIPFIICILNIFIIFSGFHYQSKDFIKETVIVGDLKKVYTKDDSKEVITSRNYIINTAMGCPINEQMVGDTLQINILSHGDKEISYKNNGYIDGCKVIDFYRKKVFNI